MANNLTPGNSSINVINQKSSLEFNESIRINVLLEFSYTTVQKLIENYNVVIEERKFIFINEIVDDLIKQGFSYLNNSAISYFDEDLRTYIYLGIAPLQANMKFTFDYNKYQTSPNNEIFVVRNIFIMLNHLLGLMFNFIFLPFFKNL